MRNQKTHPDLHLSTSSVYHYMQYQGNFPYYSDFPKLKFINKDDWRFSSDLYHRYWNLNSPLNKCYITKNPNVQFLEKSQCLSTEKLDYYYIRGYKKILNQEIEKNYERFGYESQRGDLREEVLPQPNPKYRRNEEEERIREESWMVETERRHYAKSMVQQSKNERRFKDATEGNWPRGMETSERKALTSRWKF